jgi:hypothetical protein
MATATVLFDGRVRRPNLTAMADPTPQYLKLTYEKWFDDHPGAREEIQTTTVRQHSRPGAPKTYVKRGASGEVQITKEEFDARYWAREHGTRPGV